MQETKDDQLGQHVGHADQEPQGLAGGPSADGIGQLAAEAENLVGVALDQSAGFGELQVAAGALKELRAERAFQLGDLALIVGSAR